MFVKQLLFGFTLICFVEASSAQNEQADIKGELNFPDLARFQWMHGAESCEDDLNPQLQVVQASANSYILRQNKCVTFEAPFIYVLEGSERILVVDTGANASPDESPIYETVRSLLSSGQQAKPILVVHSHSHGDHTKGDSQFAGMSAVEVVGTSNEELATELGLSDWPNKSSLLDLGERVVTFIPIPGHQEQSIAIYDEQTEWLLTGDTLYPGLIRVKNWDDFRHSIERLVSFSERNNISMILGAHIEMNRETNKIYTIGTRYQAKEMALALNPKDLKALHVVLESTTKPKKLEFDSFVISPLSWFEKALSNALSKVAK